MKQSFLKSAEQGCNAVWRYICGILIAMLLGLVGLRWVGMPISSAIGDSLVIFKQPIDMIETEENIKQFSPHSLETSYISIHFAYAFFCIGIFIAVKLLHQRKVLTLISPGATFQWQRFGIGFSLWFVLASIQTCVEFLYNPGTFIWNFQPSAWLSFLPWAIVFTPLQTSTEELLFRGYLLQGLGLVIRQPVVLTLVSSLPFAIAHFSNPEMARGAVWIGLTYWLMGIFLTLITLRDNRLELALGVHAANNLFVVLMVNTQDSALPTPALIIQQTPSDPRFTLAVLVVAIAVFYGLVFRYNRPLP
ncbi:MAG: CPBP family intramembrane glutamic endopeptidase [Leptolyngbyaceae cyanobacterium bins.302]|nr:CPBP family intramembrane glutamic endopeptidase [Leptolyngbyaceae cyanobacterium bins.302]